MKIGNKQLKMPDGAKAKGSLKKIGGVLKKNLFIICSVLLIGGAVYLNWAFFSDPEANNVTATASKNDVTEEKAEKKKEDDSSKVSAADEYFTAAAVNRQRARDESMQVLQNIIDNENTEKTARNEAYDEIAVIAAEIEAESNIESLVVSKGFEDCVAVINGDKANIIVKSSGLLENEITQIQEIVYDQAGILPSNTKIIEKK
ncbi:MAG: SpoIIIAH-like family protein [Clostridia bacterium]|nr:SpoIIIAH-like family protein [Clostridia bacterium]